MGKWQRINIPIPKGHTPSQRIAIAEEVIDTIVDRSLNGIDKDGAKFKGYSKSYLNSKDFKIAGKSGSVNLRLSGEMLGELSLLNHSNGNLRIGFDKERTELNGKVEGNRLGTYGHKKPVTKPRDFLGLPKSVLDNILAKFPIESKKEEDSKDTGLSYLSKLELLAATEISLGRIPSATRGLLRPLP